MKVKKIPLRTCIVTHEKYPKHELIRVVKFNDVVSIDETGKANGKGCYLKKDISVIEKAQKNKIIDRVLETEISEEIYKKLLELVK